MQRCCWAGTDEIYVQYHDTEWGVPQYDSRVLWEKLVLDGFQAGLSWITILKKRDNFRTAFQRFDPNIIAHWGETEISALLANPGIIRHRGKIAATITNAQAWQRIEETGGFDSFLWGYVGGMPIQNTFTKQANVPTSSPLSEQIAKDLKKAGFKLCGPTIVYAFMEAMGLINNHLVTCPRHAEVVKLARHL